MTVATNALLEGVHARTAFVATDGFADLIELGRQDAAGALPPVRRVARAAGAARAALRRARADGARGRPAPARRGGCGGRGRCGRRVAARGGRRLPAACLARPRARARCSPRRCASASATTCTSRSRTRSSGRSASTSARRRPRSTPRSRRSWPRYLRALLERTDAAGLPEPQIMQSSGGLVDAHTAAGHAALTVLSGPAGGAAAAALVARACGAPEPPVLRHGRHLVRRLRRRGRARAREPRAPDRRAPGRRCRWWTSTRSARAGARSPGAMPAARCASARARRARYPGPAAYGRGGRDPTVTDAHVVLGTLDAVRPAGGRDPPRRRGRAGGGRHAGREPRPRARGLRGAASCASRTPRWCARCGS